MTVSSQEVMLDSYIFACLSFRTHFSVHLVVFGMISAPASRMVDASSGLSGASSSAFSLPTATQTVLLGALSLILSGPLSGISFFSFRGGLGGPVVLAVYVVRCTAGVWWDGRGLGDRTGGLGLRGILMGFGRRRRDVSGYSSRLFFVCEVAGGSSRVCGCGGGPPGGGVEKFFGYETATVCCFLGGSYAFSLKAVYSSGVWTPIFKSLAVLVALMWRQPSLSPSYGLTAIFFTVNCSLSFVVWFPYRLLLSSR